MIKNCKTCGHSYGLFQEFLKCHRTGYYCSTQVKYPDANCNSNLSGWIPKEDNIFIKIIKSIFRIEL